MFTYVFTNYPLPFSSQDSCRLPNTAPWHAMSISLQELHAALHQRRARRQHLQRLQLTFSQTTTRHTRTLTVTPHTTPRASRPRQPQGHHAPHTHTSTGVKPHTGKPHTNTNRTQATTLPRNLQPKPNPRRFPIIQNTRHTPARTPTKTPRIRALARPTRCLGRARFHL